MEDIFVRWTYVQNDAGFLLCGGPAFWPGVAPRQLEDGLARAPSYRSQTHLEVADGGVPTARAVHDTSVTTSPDSGVWRHASGPPHAPRSKPFTTTRLPRMLRTCMRTSCQLGLRCLRRPPAMRTADLRICPIWASRFACSSSARAWSPARRQRSISTCSHHGPPARPPTRP